ncbi:hypothetical protein LPJ78_001746 [Coemansia sp. RSA 989]|nr:hypothetical protein LPJ68_002002 [Coemansia sp. RSA 1086]KAJ1751070.1 hypothetical protein LPJ79_002406 [Coemansia sp. RSA 1821]KAJ1866580.1 hypothetical protein LPJ78_001746 [Coemansia sp. RSA 989]KAJ2649942.1 hypothetical protein IWW40_002796 [Coemansia sp. RSA 1250]
MATVKAEYQDESGRVEAFTLEQKLKDDSTSALVSALESMQTLLNTELTNLLEAEKASDSSTQQSEQRKLI